MKGVTASEEYEWNSEGDTCQWSWMSDRKRFRFCCSIHEVWPVFVPSKNLDLCFVFKSRFLVYHIFTARVRSTREGNVFSLSQFTSGGGGGTYLLDGWGGTYSQVWMVGGGGTYLPRSGGGTYSQVWMGGYLPSQVQVEGVPTFWVGGGTYSGLVGGVPT